MSTTISHVGTNDQNSAFELPSSSLLQRWLVPLVDFLQPELLKWEVSEANLVGPGSCKSVL